MLAARARRAPGQGGTATAARHQPGARRLVRGAARRLSLIRPVRTGRTSRRYGSATDDALARVNPRAPSFRARDERARGVYLRKWPPRARGGCNPWRRRRSGTRSSVPPRQSAATARGRACSGRARDGCQRMTTLRRARPRENPGPQCAFKMPMINVSCSLHCITQLAALFIDVQAE